MCDRCANIDYPIGDSIWLPCGGSSDRYRARLKVRTPGEDDFQAQQIIWELRKQLRASEQRNKLLVAENEVLKARRPPQNDGATFEAVVVNE